ncbi:glycosyltransferase family 2 protein, partial [Pleomassaria siparia CBS 279.74]
QRRGTLVTIADALVPDAMHRRRKSTWARKSSIAATYEKAKTRGVQLQRNKWVQMGFPYAIYLFMLVFVYFVLIGVPLWNGSVWWLWWIVANKFVFSGGFAITLGIALFYAFAPLLILFEDAPPERDPSEEKTIQPNVRDTALLVPCYKSAGLIAATIEAALQVFPPSHIFVIANGNSPEPLDNTEEVCIPYGVNHVWSPIGSKIVAQFVGCYAAKDFKNVLLIDDDCALPANFPVVTERLKGKVMCIGYTIKSVGPNSSKGNLCQQAQDLEYKLSGIQRDFAGRVGSATFPHGAISLWDRKLLVKTFHEHPGFNVSEDWFFGHVARELGCRIKMCSSTFVETETPTAVFVSSGGSRGGFGEMTIFSQRFKRWNFFFVNGMWYNMKYIFGSWKLGWWEIGAKIFVFQEVYETLLYLLTPFVLPISFYVRPSFCGILLGATIVMYLVNVIIFNEIHLRRKGERLGWQLLYVYYLPYKIVLTFINVASCYWSLWKYARYFAQRHPKVIEDEHAVAVVVRLEENHEAARAGGQGRRTTVRTIRTMNTSSADSDD